MLLMWQVSKSVYPDSDAAADLGLHFLHMSEGPFSHDTCHINVLVEVFAILKPCITCLYQRAQYFPIVYIRELKISPKNN